MPSILRNKKQFLSPSEGEREGEGVSVGETQERVRVMVKRLEGHEDLALPSYETAGSSGMDLRAAVRGKAVLKPGDIMLIPTGLAVAVPQGFEAQIRPRSGLALNHGIGMVNAPGTIDSDYRGEIRLILINWGQHPFDIRRGDRIAQMVVTRVSRAELVESKNLEETSRGSGGFGHSGVE
jgi:dUTP pyrophosphatase